MVNPIIDLERLLEKVLKGEYIANKCRNTPGGNCSGFSEINLPYYGGGTPDKWFVWKDKLLKTLDGHVICTGPQRYIITEHLLRGDAKATFKQTDLDIGIYTCDSINKILADVIKQYIFPQTEALFT